MNPLERDLLASDWIGRKSAWLVLYPGSILCDVAFRIVVLLAKAMPQEVCQACLEQCNGRRFRNHISSLAACTLDTIVCDSGGVV
ncbi:MAG: hypothetical protein D6690_02865 [Nitrospirae bacterium]|nr:MAG: hypothetical protein D6690_02865 [Nitrospirota bacterium]